MFTIRNANGFWAMHASFIAALKIAARVNGWIEDDDGVMIVSSVAPCTH